MTVHVAGNGVGLTWQKCGFPIPCIKLDYIAEYNPVSPSRPAALRPIGTKMEEKDAQKLQYFLWFQLLSTDFGSLTRVDHHHERWMQLFCDANTCVPKTKGLSYIYLGMDNTSRKALWTLVSLQANNIQNSDNKGDWDYLQDHVSNDNFKGSR